MPGTRCRVLLTRAAALEKSRFDRQGRGFQLLSRQESWRLRGGWCDHNEQCRSGRDLRKLRDHGQAAKYYHDIEGYNGRLDAIQAGLLHAKLGHLAEWNAQRQAIAKRYAEQLEDVEGLWLPFEPSWSRAVYHLYVVQVPDRQEMQNTLKAVGVGTGIHYPVPLHVQQAYRGLGYRNGDLPVTERVSAEILSLPMYPQLTEKQQSKGCQRSKGMSDVPQQRLLIRGLQARAERGLRIGSFRSRPEQQTALCDERI